jgi:flagellar motor switch protein FliN/FliY
MGRDLIAILSLKVPIIVRLGHRQMTTEQVMALTPGLLIELPQSVNKPMDLMVNNVVIGHGTAVKIGEDFGLRVTIVGDTAHRASALQGSAVSE